MRLEFLMMGVFRCISRAGSLNLVTIGGSGTAALLLLLIVPVSRSIAQSAPSFPTIETVHVDITPGHTINSFDPDNALGSSIDVLSRNDIDKVCSTAAVYRAGITGSTIADGCSAS